MHVVHKAKPLTKGEQVSALEVRWRKLWLKTDLSIVDACFKVLRDLYCGPDRHYHDFEHIYESLRTLDHYMSLAENPRAIEAAIWFHDAIYDTHAADNEERSADLAGQWLNKLGEPAAFILLVRKRIMATKHDKVLEGNHLTDEQLTADIDLTPLGYKAGEFDRLGDCIRREHHWVKEDDYKKRNTRRLRAFLARRTIYYSPNFRMNFERPARKNLLRAIVKSQ